MRPVLCLAMFMLLAISTPSFAETVSPPPNQSAVGSMSDITSALDYPELQVVPRASERLRMESVNEKNWYFTHWQVEASGLATLTNALLAQGEYRPNLSQNDQTTAATMISISEVFGAGWLIGGVIVGSQKPYHEGLDSISHLKEKDERSTLFRERLAEESLERTAKLMRPIKWASALTNFSTTVVTGIYLSDQGRIVAGVAAVIGLLPLLYEDRSIDVYEKHLDYKRKIYRPMSGLDFRMSPDQKITPLAKLKWEF